MSTNTCTVDVEDWQGAAVCTVGDVGGGVLAELFPSSGTNGPSIGYRSLSFPADNGKEIIVHWTSIPAGLTLATEEDSSTVATALADGVYTAQFQMYADYAAVGSPQPAEFIFGPIQVAATWAERPSTFAVAGAASGAATPAVTGGISWSEVASSFTVVGTAADSSVAGALAWSEGGEVFAVAGTVRSGPISAAISWSEAPGSFLLAGHVGGLIYAAAGNTLASAGRVRSLGALDTTKAAFKMNFTPKRASETEVLSVDYSAVLSAGETITSATWSNAVVSGADANPSAMISGGASINGSTVSQLITGGISGVTYAPTCAATTNSGQTIVLPVPGTGHLAVKG